MDEDIMSPSPAMLLQSAVAAAFELADRIASVDQGLEIRLRGAAAYASHVAELLTYETASGESAERAAALHDEGMLVAMALADGRNAAADGVKGGVLEASYRLATGARLACRGEPGRREVRSQIGQAWSLMDGARAWLRGQELRVLRGHRALGARRPVQEHEVEVVQVGGGA